MGPDAAATLGALQAEWEAVGLSVTDVTANTEKFIKSTEKLSQAKLHIEMFKTLADTVNNSFATALDSIVTRTKSVKDAFSDMGRDILRTISRLLMSSAMQGFTKMLSGGKSGGGGGLFGLITGGLSSFLGGGGGGAANSFDDAFTSYTPSAKGNAFSGGSIIPFAKGGVFANDNIVPFANGGIVSRATMFPMNNGIGQMGEAGPEAIIPLSRGSDGKLGVSGGGTTVNQTINVTTGIQQTVRAEIQSLMPQIAAASTKAVLDARRRGGSFAGAFG
jgi:phage-related minor tail protein